MAEELVVRRDGSISGRLTEEEEEEEKKISNNCRYSYTHRLSQTKRKIQNFRPS